MAASTRGGMRSGAGRLVVLVVVGLLIAGSIALVAWRPTADDLAQVPIVSAAFDGQRSEPLIAVPGGNPENGPSAMRRYGCIACHTVPGVTGADGDVGPPLIDFANRVYIAGMLPNTPENLIYWIQHPQEVVPGNAMPELGVTDGDARDIASYLYTLAED